MHEAPFLLQGSAANCLWTLQDARKGRMPQTFSVEIMRKTAFTLTMTINAFKHTESSQDVLNNAEEITSDRTTTLDVHTEPPRPVGAVFVHSVLFCFDFATGLLKG